MALVTYPVSPITASCHVTRGEGAQGEGLRGKGQGVRGKGRSLWKKGNEGSDYKGKGKFVEDGKNKGNKGTLLRGKWVGKLFLGLLREGY